MANCSVTIRWPYEVESRYPRGKHLLYLLEQPQVCGFLVFRLQMRNEELSNECELRLLQVESLIPASCDVPRRIVNPINLGVSNLVIFWLIAI